MNRTRKGQRCKIQGSVLLATLALLMAVSLATIALVSYTRAMCRTEERKIDNLRAHYVAEAGVYKVIHLFNRPQEYYDPELFEYNSKTETFPFLQIALSQGPYQIPAEYWPSFTMPNDQLFGKVISLELLPADPDHDPPNTACRIRSVGQSQLRGAEMGAMKTVEVCIGPAIPGAHSLAGLVSLESIIDFRSNPIDVCWGEAWAHEDIHLHSNSNQWEDIIDLDSDEWAIVRTEGLFHQGPNRYVDGSTQGAEEPVLPDPAFPEPDERCRYYNPCVELCDLGEFDGRLFQNWELELQTYDYYGYKELAMRKGEYYITDSLGNIYRSGIKDAAHRVTSFVDEFSVGKEDPFRYVFIDTIDGQIPREDGANLAEILVSGGGKPHFKGLFYVNANMKITGAGNPPDVTEGEELVIRPDGAFPGLDDVWMNGLLYLSGDFSWKGNANVFGAIVVEGEVDAGGNPAIYYNYLLKDGEFFPIVSRVAIYRFEVY